MLVNTRTETNSEGFNPNVDNNQLTPNPTFGEKFLFYFLYILSWLIIIPGIIWTVIIWKQKNQWINDQMEINKAASVIDINLTKRAETLIKLLEQTKGYLKHEKETLIHITRLRSGQQHTNSEINEFNNQLNEISKNIDLTFENYPDLKGSAVIGELMSSSQYIESEISASRRLYNQCVERFNASIFVFPNVIIAKKQKLSTFPLFSASAKQKQDVDMSVLSNF